MPVTRLYPNATTLPAILATNASTHHAGLSDSSDGTYSWAQVSVFEPTKTAAGPSLTQLPTSSGVVRGVTIHCRAYIADNPDGLELIAGENSSNRFGGQNLNDVPTTYATSQLALGGVATVNSLAWNVGLQYVADGGGEGRITELDFDVEWFPVSGFTAFIVQVLGPMTALGLHEMVRVSAELWRRSRTRLLSHEMERAWRDLCADPRRRYFCPPP